MKVSWPIEGRVLLWIPNQPDDLFARDATSTGRSGTRSWRVVLTSGIGRSFSRPRPRKRLRRLPPWAHIKGHQRLSLLPGRLVDGEVTAGVNDSQQVFRSDALFMHYSCTIFANIEHLQGTSRAPARYQNRRSMPPGRGSLAGQTTCTVAGIIAGLDLASWWARRPLSGSPCAGPDASEVCVGELGGAALALSLALLARAAQGRDGSSREGDQRRIDRRPFPSASS